MKGMKLLDQSNEQENEQENEKLVAKKKKKEIN